MRTRTCGRHRATKGLLLQAVCLAILCAACTGCALWSSATQTPTQTPEPEVDLHALRPLVRVRVTEAGEVAVEFTVHNQGVQAIPADDAFAGEWQILGPSGRVVSSGQVARLVRLEPDQAPQRVGSWQGALPPGAYTIVWGAPRYGASVTYWDLEEVRGQLQVASSQVLESSSYPPTTGARAADWVQTTVDEFAQGALEGMVVLDRDGGQVTLIPGAAQGTYTSPAVDAAFGFNAIAPHWSADLPAGSALLLEVRVLSDGEEWSPWYGLEDAALFEERAQYYPETPVMIPGGRRFQCRVTATAGSGGESPVLHEVVVTYLDTSVGPATTYAKTLAKSAQTVDGVPSPPIITREGWGADERQMTWAPQYMPSRKIVVHHTVTKNGYTEAEAARWVRAIYHYHAVTLGWGDIGYNYLVDAYGNIYQGRAGGPDVVGGHVYNYNYGSTGIAVIGTHGNYAGSVPASDAAMDALAALSAWEGARAAINPSVSSALWDAVTRNLAGHRDFPPQRTSCPGDELYAQLAGLRDDVWNRLRAQLFKYNADWLEWEMPSGDVLAADTTYSATVEVRNRGWFTWADAGDHPVRLGYRWVDQEGQPVTPAGTTQRASLDRNVAFGESARFDTVVTTPRVSGTYTLVWDLVHEDMVWFNDAVHASPLLKVTYAIDDTLEPQPPEEGGGLLENGGFEAEVGWTLFDTSYPARIVTQPRRTGQRALQTGIEPGGRDVFSYSSAEQSFRLPVGARASLRFWYQASVAQGDYTYVYLRGNDRQWRLVLYNRAASDGWVEVVRDLSTYAGQQVTLRFGTFNDGRGGSSAMYVDDASVVADTGMPGPGATHTPAPPTATALPTATPMPTATTAPTATPTPTPGAACLELAVNGGFEGAGGWTLPQTAYSARYTDAVAYAGKRSLHMGISDARDDRLSYSSAEQRIALPAGRRADLRLAYNMPSAGGSGDWGYVLLRPAGGTWRVVRIVRGTTDGWESLQVDVSHYAGGSFALRVGVRNDGRRDGAAAVMYVDQVSVQACLP